MFGDVTDDAIERQTIDPETQITRKGDSGYVLEC